MTSADVRYERAISLPQLESKLAHAAISPVPRRKKSGLNTARNLLPSLTYPSGKYGNARVSYTSAFEGLALNDSFMDNGGSDLEPHPPQVAREYVSRLRVRQQGSSRSDIKWKKIPLKASPSKTQAAKSPKVASRRSTLHILSPNYREHYDKRMNMLRAAIAEQEQKKPKATASVHLVPIQAVGGHKRTGQPSFTNSQDLDQGRPQKLTGPEEPSNVAVPKAVQFKMLEEQESYMRLAIHQQLCTYWNGEARKLRVSTSSRVIQAERERRIVLLQEEMDRRTLLLGMWLGVDTAQLPATKLRGADVMHEEQQFKWTAIVAEENAFWEALCHRERQSRESAHVSQAQRVERASMSKINVLKESEEAQRDRIMVEELGNRKELLQIWLASSLDLAPQNRPRANSNPTQPQTRSSNPSPRRAPHDAEPSARRRAPSQSLQQTTFSRARQLEASQVADRATLVQDQLEASLTFQSALQTALAAVQLAEQSCRLEVLAVEKKERGSLKLWSGGTTPATRTGHRHPDQPQPKLTTPRSNIIQQQQQQLHQKPPLAPLQPYMQQQQDQSSSGSPPQSSGGSDAGPNPPVARGSSGAPSGGAPPGRPGGGGGAGGEEQGSQGGGGGNPPEEKPPAKPLGDIPRLYRAVVRVLAKDMALAIQNEDVLRKCRERTELVERHRLAFKVWKGVQDQVRPMDEAACRAHSTKVLLEEEALQRHVWEVQEDNGMLMLWWAHFSTYERNWRLERRM